MDEETKRPQAGDISLERLVRDVGELRGLVFRMQDRLDERSRIGWMVLGCAIGTLIGYVVFHSVMGV